MFDCADPATLSDLHWMLCYLTTAKHQQFYLSFGVVLGLVLLAAPIILTFGFLGAFAKRSRFLPARVLGLTYMNMVRGVPDIVFFLFVPIAMDQGLEYIRHITLCPEVTEPVYRGNDFVVCAPAKLPLSAAAPWVHDLYGFVLALLAFSVVFGAFAATTIDGALSAVPKSQRETAAAYGMSQRQIMWRIHLPQMWVYALPGFSNLWMLLIKATPLLFLLGIEDIIYWARELGSFKSTIYTYPHPNWSFYYFSFLMIFYLLFTWVSQRGFDALQRRVTFGRTAEGADSR